MLSILITVIVFISPYVFLYQSLNAYYLCLSIIPPYGRNTEELADQLWLLSVAVPESVAETASLQGSQPVQRVADIGRQLLPHCSGDLSCGCWWQACFSTEGLEAGTLHCNRETWGLLSFGDKRFKNRLRVLLALERKQGRQAITFGSSWEEEDEQRDKESCVLCRRSWPGGREREGPEGPGKARWVGANT